MRLYNRHTILLLSLCAALSACGDKENEVINVVPEPEPEPAPVVEKTPISLMVGGMDADAPVTRAVITDGTGKTMQAFDKAAYIFMVMQSEYGTADYEGSHDTKYTVMRGDVAEGQGVVTFTNNNYRYWDDAHARSSQLSIWAFAQKGQAWTTCSFQSIIGENPMDAETAKATYQTTGTDPFPWQTTPRIYPAIYEFSVGNPGPNQTATDIIRQDLLFSNNLTYNSEKSWADGRLKYNFGTRKFPENNEMKFYHAMSKITIQIKAGDGFKADGTDFTLKNSTIDLLRGFNTKGLFNIKDGEFQKIHAHADITSIPLQKTEVGKTNPYYTLEALAIPNIHEFMSTHSGSDIYSRFVKDAKNLETDVMMVFTIDDNKYQITSGLLFDALNISANTTGDNPKIKVKTFNSKDYIALEAGKNYVFTFTIGKKQINNLSATVASWENVDADPFSPSNARIKLQVEERGSELTTGLKIYRDLDDLCPATPTDDFEGYDWFGDYADMDASYSSDHWTTGLYWENNTAFYHFRALSLAGQTLETTNDDYVTLTSGTVSGTGKYSDVCWGAPFLDDGDNETFGSFKWNYGPTKNGFDGRDDADFTKTENPDKHQIYKAIGPTEDPIKLILFHAMSEITINLTTDETEGALDKVILEDGDNKTTVELIGESTKGKILMGNGRVIASNTDKSSAAASTSVTLTGTNKYQYGVVPQDLTDVQLRITTPDKNQYIVNLKDCKATTVTNENLANPYRKEGEKYVIDRWYPGYKYIYTFKLTKKGTFSLLATIVEWGTVTADEEGVQIQ